MAMLTESSDAMRLRGEKYVQVHAYRRHPVRPNDFCRDIFGVNLLGICDFAVLAVDGADVALV
jgi:hypothetical protein